MSDLLAQARRIRAATLFRPGQPPQEHATFDALLTAVRQLAAQADATFTPAQVAYPDLDPFRGISLRIGGQLEGFIADTWADDTDRDFALRILRKAVTPERLAA